MVPKDATQPDGGLPNQWHRERFQQLIGTDNPFELVRKLTGPLRKDVYLARYLSPDLSPQGLGQWNGVQEARLDPSHPWVEEPMPGADVVIKRVSLPIQNPFDDGQRKALLATNRVFSREDPQRPIRFHGYGTAYDDPYRGYLVLEYVQPSFMEFPRLVPIGKSVPLESALEIAVVHGSFLNKLHAARITHHDLEGPGLEHLFYDPVTKEEKVIDWEYYGSNSYVGDQTGIGQILMRSLTGQDFNPRTYQSLLAKHLPPELFDRVTNTIELSIGLSFDRKNKHYSRSPRGTQKMYQDLLSLQRDIGLPGK